MSGTFFKPEGMQVFYTLQIFMQNTYYNMTGFFNIALYLFRNKRNNKKWAITRQTLQPFSNAAKFCQKGKAELFFINLFSCGPWQRLYQGLFTSFSNQDYWPIHSIPWYTGFHFTISLWLSFFVSAIVFDAVIGDSYFFFPSSTVTREGKPSKAITRENLLMVHQNFFLKRKKQEDGTKIEILHIDSQPQVIERCKEPDPQDMQSAASIGLWESRY